MRIRVKVRTSVRFGFRVSVSLYGKWVMVTGDPLVGIWLGLGLDRLCTG